MLPLCILVRILWVCVYRTDWFRIIHGLLYLLLLPPPPPKKSAELTWRSRHEHFQTKKTKTTLTDWLTLWVSKVTFNVSPKKDRFFCKLFWTEWLWSISHWNRWVKCGSQMLEPRVAPFFEQTPFVPWFLTMPNLALRFRTCSILLCLLFWSTVNLMQLTRPFFCSFSVRDVSGPTWNTTRAVTAKQGLLFDEIERVFSGQNQKN